MAGWVKVWKRAGQSSPQGGRGGPTGPGGGGGGGTEDHRLGDLAMGVLCSGSGWTAGGRGRGSGEEAHSLEKGLLKGGHMAEGRAGRTGRWSHR